jgi:Protease inhibitor Inh
MTMARIAGALVVASMLAGCSGERTPLGETAAAPKVPNDEMAGRWILSAPDAPTCGMNFSGPPGAHEGVVVAEGGCPEKFFMSRRWSSAQGALVINDDKNNALAHFSFTDGRFSGQSAAGTPVTLTR